MYTQPRALFILCGGTEGILAYRLFHCGSRLKPLDTYPPHFTYGRRKRCSIPTASDEHQLGLPHKGGEAVLRMRLHSNVEQPLVALHLRSLVTVESR
ncbi:hypothetical protein Moror_10614 [Moniliophthora roreri MCA 2997]|uniref:Uncharacterized protein n=1 Tax=Moniliophthora roreri (strain MCA 2997) TaxID=1381753 RepID=V2XH15_MONRO|nr:hypothetical protein Moror_10614 [Moniliophthora roreri MCA 2997]